MRFQPKGSSETALESSFESKANFIATAERNLTVKRAAADASLAGQLKLFVASIREDDSRTSLNISTVVEVITNVAFENACTNARIETDTNVQLRIDVPICACRQGGQGKSTSDGTKNKTLDHLEEN